MNYTWGEIQIIAVQKMFLNNVSLQVSDLPTMKTDRKYEIYLNAMPAAANEGLLRLMNVSRPQIKKYTMTYYVPENVFDQQSNETYSIVNDELIVSKSTGYAYYFEVDNDATITIQKYTGGNWVDEEVINHTQTIGKQYTVYKKRIDNTNDEEVRIVFAADGKMYNIRNIALYEVDFQSDEEVINNTTFQRYDMRTLISDFYDIVTVEFEPQKTNKGSYNSDYKLEGDYTLKIDSNLRGNFIITYKAYPDKIEDDTLDTYMFTMNSEVISILPLYIVSELYKDDDVSLATMYRNQFETELLQLDYNNEPLDFADNSGWL